MGKLNCKYKISNHKEYFQPNDVIEGICYLESEEEKDQKLKNVEVQLVEKFDQFVTRKNQQTGEVISSWAPASKTKEKVSLAKGDLIRSGETKEFPFKINLPSKWKVRSGTNVKNWHLALIFKYKTKLKATQGANPFDSTYVIPVKGSQVQSYAASADGEEQSDDMKFCSECGKKIKRTAKFCEHCGSQSA